MKIVNGKSYMFTLFWEPSWAAIDLIIEQWTLCFTKHDIMFGVCVFVRYFYDAIAIGDCSSEEGQ